MNRSKIIEMYIQLKNWTNLNTRILYTVLRTLLDKLGHDLIPDKMVRYKGYDLNMGLKSSDTRSPKTSE